MDTQIVIAATAAVLARRGLPATVGVVAEEPDLWWPEVVGGPGWPRRSYVASAIESARRWEMIRAQICAEEVAALGFGS